MSLGSQLCERAVRTGLKCSLIIILPSKNSYLRTLMQHDRLQWLSSVRRLPKGVDDSLLLAAIFAAVGPNVLSRVIDTARQLRGFM